MTDVAPALTDTEIAALAGPSIPRWFMVFDTSSGNTVGTARVNAPGGLTYPLITLPCDGQDSGWANILPDQTLLIGSTPGGFDKGIYRVRWDGFLTYPNIEIMAIGENDSGEINIATRNVGIADNDYVTVLDRFDPFGKFPHIVYSGVGVDADIFEDWDNGIFTFNQHPPGISNITIDGQHANYAAHVFGGTSKTFNITANIILWPTSSSVTWTWVLPAGWALNSGSLFGSGLTNTINVTAPHSADTYTLQFIAQENNGINWNAYRKVWIKSFTYPPLDIVRIDSSTDDRTGSKRTVTLNKLIGMPPGAMVHLFDAGTWNGTDVPTASKCFTGYVQRRREITDIGVANVSLDLIGPSYMLELIGGQSQVMSAVNAIPVNWQQVYYTLSYLDFIIWWVLYNRAAGMLSMFNYTPFGLSNTQKRMTDWRVDAGTILSQLKALASRFCGGNIGCDPTGEFMLRRKVSQIPWADRGSVPIRCALDAGIYESAELDYEEHPQVRRLRGECFVSDGLTVDTPYWCDAPIIPGQGAREEKLERLICDDTTEFYGVTGDDFQARNNPYPAGTIKIPKNYAVIYPAQMSRVNLDIAPALRYDGVEYTGYVLPVQVTYTHNADGTIDTEVQVEAETVGLPATDVPIPQPDPSTYNSYYSSLPFNPIPSWQSPNPNPAGTKKGATVTPTDGSVGFMGDATHAIVYRNFLGTPQYTDVTPATLGSFQITHGIIAPGTKRAYFIANDGANSAVWTTANLFALPKPTWTKGTSYAGVYTLVRTTQTAGNIEIYTPTTAGAPGSATITFDAGGYAYTIIHGTVAGGGNPGNCLDGGSGDPTNAQVELDLLSPVTVTAAQLDWKKTQADPLNIDLRIYLYDGSHSLVATYNHVFNTPANSWQTWNPGVSTTANIRYVGFQAISSGGGGPALDDFLDNCSVTYGGGNAQTRLSTDYGATFASAVTVGASPGAVGGFDVQHQGAVSIASALNEIKKATTLGGAYSNDQAVTGTSAASIELPWYTRNSLSALNTGSSPQYIYGLPVVDGSSHALYWVVSGSPVNITPTISGNPGLSPTPNNITTYKGVYIACILTFGGTPHLVTSIDGGATFVDRGAISGANYVRVRRLAATPGQLFGCGNGVLFYSPDFGTTIVNKPKPATNLLFVEPYG